MAAPSAAPARRLVRRVTSEGAWADRAFRADVLCDGDRIVAVGDNLDAPAGAKVIDAAGQYVMPGGIDRFTRFTPRTSP